ncbi:hypothetical protein GGI02_005033 [Coemansia sp. RSA 2322]|nr:hypothetical protein GGI02_005033 [Coemansia sp. RSA 2322]
MPGRFAYPLLSNANMLDQSLNRSQKDAVRLALAAGEIALIHGPPGTGKTHTLLEIIRQFVRQGQRILVCGPSNVSVDNLAERLGKLRSMSLVRVGHPARILPGAAKYGLDYQINSKDKSERSNAIREEIDVLTLFLQQCTVNEDHRQLGAQIKKLKRREEAFRPKEADQIIAGAQVVLSTLNGAASPVLASSRVFFDVVIIDEATQTTEAECWIAAQKAPKLILAGDHHQLPPTVMSVGDPTLNVKRGSRRGPEQLQFTMFERMREKLDKRFCQMLTTQYRMNQQIMKVSAERLYGGLLVADESVAKHVLSSLPHVRETKSTRAPIVYINTAGCGLRESQEETQFRKAQGSMLDQSEVRSKVNVGEADLAVLYVDELIAAGVPAKDIALISPYGGQVRLLKMLLRAKYPDLEIGSVDGFQGREKEAVILSFVRSNEQCSIGFLRDYRRNNVAITRARRHLCIIADGKTVPAHDPFLKAFFAHLRRAAIIRVPILAD